MKKCEERRLQEDAVAKQAKQGFSLCLRKFRWDCENFAILAKFSLCENFARLAKFRYLAKFTVPSENTQFRYLKKISRG